MYLFLQFLLDTLLRYVMWSNWIDVKYRHFELSNDSKTFQKISPDRCITSLPYCKFLSQMPIKSFAQKSSGIGF